MITTLGLARRNSRTKRLPLIDGICLYWIGVEDSLADIPQLVVHRISQGVNLGYCFSPGYYDARAPVLLEVTRDRVKAARSWSFGSRSFHTEPSSDVTGSL